MARKKKGKGRKKGGGGGGGAEQKPPAPPSAAAAAAPDAEPVDMAAPAAPAAAPAPAPAPAVPAASPEGGGKAAPSPPTASTEEGKKEGAAAAVGPAPKDGEAEEEKRVAAAAEREEEGAGADAGTGEAGPAVGGEVEEGEVKEDGNRAAASGQNKATRRRRKRVKKKGGGGGGGGGAAAPPSAVANAAAPAGTVVEEKEKEQEAPPAAPAVVKEEEGGGKGAVGGDDDGGKDDEKEEEVEDGQTHGEMHLRPSEAMAACDGDDSASRSGSEGGGDGDGDGDVGGGGNEEMEHVLFEDGEFTAERAEAEAEAAAMRGDGGGGGHPLSDRDSAEDLTTISSRWAAAAAAAAGGTTTPRGSGISAPDLAACSSAGETTPKVGSRTALTVPPASELGTAATSSLPAMPSIALGAAAPAAVPGAEAALPHPSALVPPRPAAVPGNVVGRAITPPPPARVSVVPNLLHERRISDVTSGHESLVETPVPTPRASTTVMGQVTPTGSGSAEAETTAAGEGAMGTAPAMPAASELGAAPTTAPTAKMSPIRQQRQQQQPIIGRPHAMSVDSGSVAFTNAAAAAARVAAAVGGGGSLLPPSTDGGPSVSAPAAGPPGTPLGKRSRFASLPCRTEEEDEAPAVDSRIRLGICAMDKKARSKPMGEILSRLDENLFEVVFFGDQLIRDGTVEEWPVVDVLIAFYSSGYPLAKAEEYVELRRPFVLNDLAMQWTLKDRREVYDLLKSSGIDVPRHVYMNRDGYVSTFDDGSQRNGPSGGGAGGDDGDGSNGGDGGGGSGSGNGELIEHDDHIEVNGVVINKPFVEKPVDADDHNIAIYYPTSAGGGCKKLFRKVGDRSSEFYADINEVRRDGSYIYEEFVETQGTDVKMYTVGPDYGHAEARKSPTVDGKVERNSDGKEVRFPVILTLREKEIARRIVIVFKQQVCGFDLLRVQEGDSLVSYVCDVNGWSFVKNSRKYYDDCAQILTEHMLAAVKPTSLSCFSALDPLLTTISDMDMDHPDTPKKQRRKTHTSAIQRVSRMLQGEPPLTPAVDARGPSISPKRADGADGVAATPLTPSLSAPTTLSEGAMPVSQIPHQLATNPPSIVTSAASSVVDDGDDESLTKEPSTHKEELRCVIAVIRHGDRTPKQKLKLNMSEPRVLQYFEEHCESPKKDLKVKAKKPLEEFLKTIILMISEKEAEAKALGTKRHLLNDDGQILYKLRHMRDVLQRWKIGGLNRKLQIKPRKWEEVEGDDGQATLRCTEVQLILKWGGNLTKLGERQSINLGQRLRHELYPDAPGGGILRLHSTFRHDLKIKTSDEGRVMKTAAAGAKGLLELEGEIPPILVSLVHKEKDSIHMLDPSGNKEVKKELEECKSKINENLQKDFDFDETSVEEHEKIVGPATLVSLHKALQEVGNPRKTLFAIRSTMGDLLEQLDEMLGLMTSGDESRNEGGEGLRGEGEGALSGIKLYKGETLLELTERWRLLYRKFYDEDSDVFDLSRVPDVHDNVRFDMLHNPHLGLTATLEKLYNMAKVMADCVVPQEYGSTILEKRSIGQKMCRALLDKIKYDLIIARTDNQVDMRYMINMDYSADLPINTMGRRIRTRLYFTSESHLHTLLNVLRFTSDDPAGSSHLLSKRGRQLVDENPELCYLTQIVFRLFEDPKKDLADPKRFRIEIFFSPGATATPLHMAEMDRDLDNSRFETDPLEMISKENLSCSELEDYFSEAIKEGKTDEDDDASIISTVASMEDKKKKKSKKEVKQAESNASSALTDRTSEKPTFSKVEAMPKLDDADEKKIPESTAATDLSLAATTTVDTAQSHVGKAEVEVENIHNSNERVTKSRELNFAGGESESAEGEVTGKAKIMNEDERLERMARILEKKYFWTSVAAVSFVVGVGCLVLSRNLGDRTQRRWSRR